MHYHQTPPDKDPELWEMAQRRTTFKRHLSIYIIMSIFFWVLWYISGGRFYHGGLPWPVWPMLGWGIGVAFNYLGAYGASSKGSTEREYQKLKEQQSKNQ